MLNTFPFFRAFHFIPVVALMLMATGCNTDGDDDDDIPTPTGWSNLGNLAIEGSIVMSIDANDHLYIGVTAQNSENDAYVMEWNGSSWTQLGALGHPGFVTSICTAPDGSLYIGATFNLGVDYDEQVRQWNGSSWVTLGDFPGNYLSEMTTDASGNLYVADGISVFRWNGSTWSEMNWSGYNHWVNTVLVDAGGNVYAGGGAFTGGTLGTVGMWNGSGFSAMGDLNDHEQAYAMCTDPAGNIYAAGGFAFQSGYVVKWNGSGWVDLGLNGNEMVNTIVSDADGNIYAAGEFYNANIKRYIAKYDGTAWTDIFETYGQTNTLCIGSDGSIYAAGYMFSNKSEVAVFRP